MRPTVFGLLLPQNFMLAWHCNTNAEEWLLCKISYHQMLKSLFDISHWRGNHIVPCQHTVIWSAKMLRGARMAGLVKLHRSADRWSERRLWVAPALQVFFGDIRGLFVSTVVCPACLCFGIASTGPDECRERGSNRLIDLKGP